MTIPHPDISEVLDVVVEHLDVPRSYYERAAARHRSLGEWLHSVGSKVAAFDPDVRPQGSFRFGTVIRPLRKDEEYDLDNVCVLRKLGKNTLSQRQLKELYGAEIKAYAEAKQIKKPVTEHNRCWRLQYSDEVAFHLDTLPCVPAGPAVIQRLIATGVPSDLAGRAVAITDKRHPQYDQITQAWISSNPRGFARWFEQRAALGRQRAVTENRAQAAIEDVPSYEWKTTLQRSIQLLKRHRDVMFRNNPDLAPISMIITNLAAHAYGGEADLVQALTRIVDKMPAFVRDQAARVPNPADPAEDYADKWRMDPRLEKSFWDWQAAVKTDVARFVTVVQRSAVKEEVLRLFDVELNEGELRQFVQTAGPVMTTAKATPTLIIPSAPRPWRQNG